PIHVAQIIPVGSGARQFQLLVFALLLRPGEAFYFWLLFHEHGEDPPILSGWYFWHYYVKVAAHESLFCRLDGLCDDSWTSQLCDKATCRAFFGHHQNMDFLKRCLLWRNTQRNAHWPF